MGPIEYWIDLYGRCPILGLALLLLGATLFGYFDFGLSTSPDPVLPHAQLWWSDEVS